MNFIEFLKTKDEKFGQLKIKEAIYFNDSGAKQVELHLLFPDKFGSINDEEKEKILDFANLFVDNKYEITIKYQKSYVDNEILWDAIKMFFDNNLKFADNLIKKENVSYKLVDEKGFENKQNENYDCYHLILTMPKSLYNVFINQDLSHKLLDFLHDKICANFFITLDPSLQEENLQNIIKMNDNRQTELSYLRDVSIPEEDKFYQFELVENLIGQVPDNYAIRLDQLKTASQKKIIAGTLKYFNEKQYIDKKDETKERVFFTIQLEDYWGKMRCVYFPNQNTLEEVKKLKEGDEVAIFGDYENYNGNFSFKVNSIAYAKIGEKPADNIKWRKSFDEYLVVQPEEYVEVSQLTLLDNEPHNVSEYLQKHDVVVFDFETTGLNVDDAYILELGAVKIHNGELTETFETLVKPPVSIPEEITALTHITEDMVADAPSYELVLADFYKFTRGCVLSAYNIEFDAKFLEKYGRSILFNFDNEQVDTLLLARQKVKGLPNYKLKTVVTHLNIELVSAHRALDDAVAAAKVFQKLI